jgi:phenylacetaldehyde dehydrogenase
MLHGGPFIDGEAAPAGDGPVLDVLDPSTGQAAGAVTAATDEDVDRAAAAARRALAGPWSRISPIDRGMLLTRLADAIEREAGTFAHVEARTAGKPITEVLNYDLPRTIEHFRYYGGWPGKLTGDVIDVPHEALVYTLNEPVGVVGQIIPWNFPLMLAAWKVAPALAAGCTVMLKPAQETPLTAIRLAELAVEAGIPPGVFNVLPGGAEIGARIASHEGIDKVSFTGSTGVGREIVRASAGNLKRLSLELGGKNPTVVFADADLERAAKAVARGAFFHTGQVCVAGSRLLVEEGAREELLALVTTEAATLRAGRTTDAGTTLGPVISQRHLERVRRFVELAQTQGAAIAGGGRPPLDWEGGYFLEPTIVSGLAEGSELLVDEIFGPVLTVQSFSSENEAVELANATRYGLVGGVFTGNGARGQRVARRIQAGTVWVNTYMQGDSAVPTGGRKSSGYGWDRGREALLEYTAKKVIWTPLEG